MNNTIPFDLELAKNGAQVITTDGDKVKIVNFDLKVVPSYPILGIITRDLPHGSFEDYEVWPASGSYDEFDQVGLGRTPPPDLLIVQDETAQHKEANRHLLKMIERLEGELSASRHNYGQATLKIQELEAVVDKERRERIRLEDWQKETLKTLKGWALVEAWVDRDVCLREIEIKGHPKIVIERLETLKGLKKLLDNFKE